VCDVIPERACEAQRRTSVPQAWTDCDRMLTEADIDLLVDLTPTQDHTECISKAIDAHKHAYTEKPIARSSVDGRYRSGCIGEV
jgi:predicted dehydrogenase